MIGILLLNLLSANFFNMQEVAHRAQLERLRTMHLLSILYCLLIGVLINWRAVENLVLRKTKLKPNLLLIPGALLLLISAMHVSFVFEYISWDFHFPFPIGGVGLDMLLGPLKGDVGYTIYYSRYRRNTDNARII